MRYKIDDIVTLIMDYRGKTPKKLGMDWTENSRDILAISAKNIKNGRLINKDKAHYGDENLYKKWMKDGDIKVGDILMTSEAPLGESYLITKPLKAILSQRTFLIRLNKELADPWFFYSLIQSPMFKMKLLAKATGTTVIGIKQKELRKIIVDLPSLNIQKKIGYYFKVIDQKIRLNNQINDNLVELINLIYLKFCADFPAKEKVSLDDVFNTSTKTFNVNENKNINIWHFSIPNFDCNKQPQCESTNSIKSNKKKVNSFGVLVSKLNPNFKRIWAPNLDFYSNYSPIASPEFIQINGNSQEEQALIFCILNSKEFTDFLVSNATGSTNSRQRVKPKIAVSYIIPFDLEKKKGLESLVSPILKDIQQREFENTKLQIIKDTLLNKYF
ncbi:restriction endonuclease subunit S [Limosilactobacillus reuteri]|uniref:restriction endonuclease subunit S n=1 Tax=Limosilactobacillus reuteri TaxID=1598 RepID=UPI00232CFE51|nr:restriction endonuclease subunit S [Limosilactobacillus reuteri]